MITKHKFPYKWNLATGYPPFDKGEVFSCFSCGGGSTMGYKLAGFNVIGMNEIDSRMAEVYLANHNPKFVFVEGIQAFSKRNTFPAELMNLKILDGSPPCSSFSMSGNREDDWGVEKKFKEGQADQILDTLFFDFILLAKKLQPKVVVAENVKGLMMGDAIQYVRKIYSDFEEAGYNVQHWLLDSSLMGVPQKRERVFFIALRNDLCEPFLYQKDMFTQAPYLDLKFNEPTIKFGMVRSPQGSEKGLTDWTKERLNLLRESDRCISDINEREFGKVSRFNAMIISDDEIYPTLTSSETNYRRADRMACTDEDYISVQTFPRDYDFNDQHIKYICGMSVPPLMTAHIATRIHEQWLSKL